MKDHVVSGSVLLLALGFGAWLQPITAAAQIEVRVAVRIAAIAPTKFRRHSTTRDSLFSAD
jgi:hypothetical protein